MGLYRWLRQCYSDIGVPMFLGIPIPKTLMIKASPSHITLAICVRVRVTVRVTGDAYITWVLAMGMAKTRGCPYHCDCGNGNRDSPHTPLFQKEFP